DPLGLLDFLAAGFFFARAEHFVGHVRIGGARAHAVHLDVIVANFVGKAFGETHDGGLGCGVGGEVGARVGRTAAGNQNDFAGTLFNHAGQNRAAGIGGD